MRLGARLALLHVLGLMVNTLPVRCKVLLCPYKHAVGRVRVTLPLGVINSGPCILDVLTMTQNATERSQNLTAKDSGLRCEVADRRDRIQPSAFKNMCAVRLCCRDAPQRRYQHREAPSPGAPSRSW